MVGSARCIAIVPARGGSKGILNKNRRLFLGKPLIEWTIRTAVESDLFDRIIVSTDDTEIALIAKNCEAEVPFIRPRSLASDVTSTADVIRHAVDWLELNQDYCVPNIFILEPTSPGRRVQHITQAIEMLAESGVDSVASVTKIPHHFSPSKQLILVNSNQLVGIDGTHPREMIHRRQSLPDSFAFDGTVFSCKYNVLESNPPTVWGTSVKGFVVEDKYSVDLDENDQWIPAEEKLRNILLHNS